MEWPETSRPLEERTMTQVWHLNMDCHSTEASVKQTSQFRTCYHTWGSQTPDMQKTGQCGASVTRCDCVTFQVPHPPAGHPQQVPRPGEQGGDRADDLRDRSDRARPQDWHPQPAVVPGPAGHPGWRLPRAGPQVCRLCQRVCHMLGFFFTVLSASTKFGLSELM